MGEGTTAVEDGVAIAAAGGFNRMPAGVCRMTGLVSLGGGDEESVDDALTGGVKTGVG